VYVCARERERGRERERKSEGGRQKERERERERKRERVFIRNKRERGDSHESRQRDQGSMIAIKEIRRHPLWSHNHLVRECCGVVEEAE